MLYLVRKHDESIIINGNIEVKIVEIRGKSVKLGFEFPESATVLRKEVHDRIAQENMAASGSDTSREDLDIFSSMPEISGSTQVNLGEPNKDEPLLVPRDHKFSVEIKPKRKKFKED